MNEKKPRTEDSYADHASEIDIYSLHEQHAGRLIIDPAYFIPPLQLNPSNSSFSRFLERQR